MAEAIFPAVPVWVRFICDSLADGETECSGEMKPTGMTYLGHPAGHEHECDRCGRHRVFAQTYPFIRWEAANV